MFKRFIKYAGNCFANPNGIGGKIATKLMNIMNQKQYKTLLKKIELKPNNIILDIGFGNGYMINVLFRQNIPIIIYGIDISGDMLNSAVSRNKQKIDNGSLKLFVESIGKTSFEKDLFDKIYTINTVYFWNDLEKCFSEIKRILKPNGIFFNLIYTKDKLDETIFSKYGFNKYSVKEMEDMTKENGMEIIETIEIVENKSYCIISKNKRI
jgi:ubiquinone/menaquinone biosynthesis C-methylase UbiE